MDPRTNEELAAALEQLKARGLTFGQCVKAFNNPADAAYITAAQRHVEEGYLEVDDNAVVSHGDESGSYVMAWLFVENT